jgi:hypothetical protein
MRPIHFRTISAGVLAFLTLMGTAAAQTPSSAVLNSLEVQELVKRAEPADHARLGAHFAALADRYAADAKKHTAMAKRIAAPARRTAANSAADHCKRLAERTQSASTLRSSPHTMRGWPAARHRPAATVPVSKGERVHRHQLRGVGALAARASTRPTMERSKYSDVAKRYAADANDHATMAQAYRGTRITQAAAHCDRLVTLSRDSAKEANAAAAMHKDLAGAAR